jgi:uncharacterized membrane protein YdjX (TVP38/TMEM64 family)
VRVLLKRIGLTIFYTVIGYLLYQEGDALLKLLQSTGNLFIVVLVVTSLALFPVVPYPVIGGILGAAYGAIFGGFLAWLCSVIASVAMFVFVRFGYRDIGYKLLHKRGFDKVTVLFEKNAFLTIVFARIIPIVPSVGINVYAGLSKVSIFVFTVASAAGKAPTMLLFAIVGDNLFSNSKTTMVTLFIYALFLIITFFVYTYWTRKTRIT